MTRIKFLERDEVRKIITFAGNYMERALMETLFSTGLRVSECVSLTREELDRAKGETKAVSIIGKGGYQGIVYFCPAALGALEVYLNKRTDSDPRLFPITKRTVERIVKRAAIAANVKATPHTFRHSFATHILRETGNIRYTQELLRHKSLTSTMVYTGVVSRELHDLHKKIF